MVSERPFIWKLILFFPLVIIDYIKKKKSKEIEAPYGIRMYVGMPGEGKTLSMVEYLVRLKQKNPNIKIYTNFGFKLETGPIENLEAFKDLYDDNGVVFAVDEIQLSFAARKYQSFPTELIYVLTQNRKFKKHFVCTAQLFEHVDKVFRDLTNHVIDCRNFLHVDRWFFQKAYLGYDYKRFFDPTRANAPVVMWRYSFIATRGLRALYDTMFVVASFMKDKAADQDEARPDGPQAGQAGRASDSEKGVASLDENQFIYRIE